MPAITWEIVGALTVLAVLAVAAAYMSRRDTKTRRVRVGLFVERDRYDDKEDDGEES